MKFGRDLEQSMVKEWEEHYCAYQVLKEKIKSISQDKGSSGKDGGAAADGSGSGGAASEGDHTDFFLLVERELEKVNKFYLHKLNDIERELSQINSSAASRVSTTQSASDTEDMRTASLAGRPFVPKDQQHEQQLLAIYRELGQLQSFVWLNQQAFSKIMKKYDKHMSLRDTEQAKSAAFDKRLESEPFRSSRLDSMLELYRSVRSASYFVGRGNSQEMQMRLIPGSANPALAEELAARLGVPITEAKCKRFNDGECSIQIMENIRGADVFIIQPTCQPVNDNLVELLLLVSAARRASAARVTAVVPYYGYARQDRKDRARVPISAADVARMMEAMGVDRVCCVDLHCGQIQGFFGPRTPVDNLFAGPIALSYFKLKNLKNPVVVSPDAGGVTRAKAFLEGLLSMDLNVSLAVIIKQRARAGVVGSMHLVGSVEGCDCIIVDDMIDTAGTLCTAANELKTFGAERVFAFATHGLFNGPAGTRIESCALEEVVVANTVPLRAEVQAVTKKIRVISVGKLLDGAIRAIHTGESISALFKTDIGGRLLA
eukprot:CAMPEP_0118963292 /NCGR_PEP_ID=MMETSP1173-20130426/1257_1 /TAXON_ID=1034831 /ORGANISM="Rhizochromulina marina cf, Strain CCMP1243" /LENGTH=545 /DNA_ID=CAMNT_0006911615 /DNA_START=51 /DNA_END=1688 /DNA_ORIENTATION=+